jgi:Ras-related protein Rab-11A
MEGAALSDKPDYVFKVVMVGTQKVGKTQLLNRYTKDQFDQHSKGTIGVELTSKSIIIKDKNVSIQLWDTVGQEKFKSLTAIYYQGAVGALLVYDITSRESFDHICTQWMKELKGFAAANIVSILIGNKSDLQDARQVTQEDATAFAQKEGRQLLNCRHRIYGNQRQRGHQCHSRL